MIERCAPVLERADELARFTEEPGRITRPLASPSLAAAMAPAARVDGGRGPARPAATRSATSPGAAGTGRR